MLKQLRFFMRAMAVLGSFLIAPLTHASVQMSGRHIFILYPGVDSVWGSYLFMVNNNGTQPERFSFPVMLPVETIDFQGQDSLGPNDLKLGSDGGLTIDKVFDPGDNLLNIGFKLPAKIGEGAFTVKSNSGFESLGIFVFEGKFLVNGPQLEVRKGVDFSGRNYDTYTATNGEAGKTYNFVFEGIPEGRGRLWIIGWIMAGFLLIIGFTLAAVTRPQVPKGVEESI